MSVAEGIGIILIIMLTCAMLVAVLGLGGSAPRAGRGRSFVERHEEREPLPRSKPDDYQDKDGDPYR